MRLKTFKHLALVTALATVLAACGGGNSADPMAAASQISDTNLSWVDQPASIKWEGADAESAAALKERRGRNGRRGSGNNTDTTTESGGDSSGVTTESTSGSGSTSSGSTSSGGTSSGNTASGNTASNSGSSGSSDTASGETTTGNGSTGTDSAAGADSSSNGEGNSNSDSANNNGGPNVSAQASFASGNNGAPAGAASGTYGAVTFDEEWNGSLDRSKWSTRMPHWGNAPELDNWKIEDGQLKIWTPKMANGQFLFENRAMVTHDKFNQRYGWFEMEAKLPPGQGMWPSFWLYGIYGTDRPEIDIMESHGGVDEWWGDPNPIDYGATVWLGQLNGNHERVGMVRPTHYGLTPGDLTTGFHKYGALWEPDGITFFLDGQQIGDKIHTSRMNREMWIIVGLGTGVPGTYNAPTSRTPTNSEFVINYVRAWALPGGVTTVNGSTVN